MMLLLRGAAAAFTLSISGDSESPSSNTAPLRLAPRRANAAGGIESEPSSPSQSLSDITTNLTKSHEETRRNTKSVWSGWNPQVWIHVLVSGVKKRLFENKHAPRNDYWSYIFSNVKSFVLFCAYLHDNTNDFVFLVFTSLERNKSRRERCRAPTSAQHRSQPAKSQT